MDEEVFRVEVTESFLKRLVALEAFLSEHDAIVAYDALLAELRTTVIPNLMRFPRIGRAYVDHVPRSVEAISQLGALPVGAVASLREYLHGDYLILYALGDRTVWLLSIRHHRELAYDFARIWQA